MGTQCHIGAHFGVQRFQLPAELLPPVTFSRRLRCQGGDDLAGAATPAHGAAVASTSLQGPRTSSDCSRILSYSACSRPCSLFGSRASPRSWSRCSGGNLHLGDSCLTTDICEEGTETAGRQMDNAVSVYLYVPNIIGYMRVLMNCAAFTLCFTNKKLFVVLYFISFVCDGLDGWFARKLNQVSTFGAAVDMVTDRVSTTCLLVILSHIYSPGLIFLSLLALDIASHWLQMYSTFLLGNASHKDTRDSAHWLLKAYYRNRLIMGFCCIGSEVIYITLFLLAEKQPENMVGVIVSIMKRRSIFLVPFVFGLLGWALKQVVNVLQMKTAADVCVLYDMNRRRCS